MVDDLMLWIANGMGEKRNILSWLGCTASGSSTGSAASSSTPPQLSTAEECQRLRLWLNGYFEFDGKIADLLPLQPETGVQPMTDFDTEEYLPPPHLRDVHLREDPGDEHMVEEEEDHFFLVQRPPWERKWWESQGRVRDRHEGIHEGEAEAAAEEGQMVEEQQGGQDRGATMKARARMEMFTGRGGGATRWMPPDPDDLKDRPRPEAPEIPHSRQGRVQQEEGTGRREGQRKQDCRSHTAACTALPS